MLDAFARADDPRQAGLGLAACWGIACFAHLAVPAANPPCCLLVPLTFGCRTVAVAEQLQTSGIAEPALAQQLDMILGPGGMGEASSSTAAVPDELAYSKKPRPVQYRPYGLKDYEGYDVKRAAGYWQLGRLGPENENAELQAKVRLRLWWAGWCSGVACLMGQRGFDCLLLHRGFKWA